MSAQLQFDLAAAKEAANRGIEAVSLSNKEFINKARRIAVDLGVSQGVVTADDLRKACEKKGIEPKSSNAWGAVFRDGNWTPDGFIRSKQVQGHGNLIRVWRYKYSNR